VECERECPLGEACSNQGLQRYEYAYTQVAACGDKGLGLVALETIPAGDLVLEYVGEVVHQGEVNNRHTRRKRKTGTYTMVLGGTPRMFIDAYSFGNESRFINHSCDPNCEMQKWSAGGQERIGIYSLREVPLAEELTFDYFAGAGGRVQWLDHKEQKCLCGARNCTGYLGVGIQGGEDCPSEHHMVELTAPSEILLYTYVTHM
jgi:histone-lysine N-methyltransferase SETD2